jgi:hypothetical protein
MDAEALPAEAHMLIDRLSLQPHPEGGWFRETFRSPSVVSSAWLHESGGTHDRPDSDAAAWLQSRPADRSARPLMTSILFMLTRGDRSQVHRLRWDEIWLHHRGDNLILRAGASCDGQGRIEDARAEVLGQGPQATFQALVPRGWWQEAEVEPGPHGFALVACVVSPGFEFADLEMHPAVGGG